MPARSTPIFFKLYLQDPEIPYFAASLIPVGATRWSYMINGLQARDDYPTARLAEAAALGEIRGALIRGLDLTHRSICDTSPTRERDRPDPSSPQSENYLVTLFSRAGHQLTIRTSRKRSLRYLAAAKRCGATFKHRRPVVQEPSGRKRNAEEWVVTLGPFKRAHIVTLACRAPKRRPDPIMTRVGMPDPQKPWWEE